MATRLRLILEKTYSGIELSPLSAAAAVRNHPDEFYALLDEMLDAAEDEARRSRVKRLKAMATQLPLFGEVS